MPIFIPHPTPPDTTRICVIIVESLRETFNHNGDMTAKIYKVNNEAPYKVANPAVKWLLESPDHLQGFANNTEMIFEVKRTKKGGLYQKQARAVGITKKL